MSDQREQLEAALGDRYRIDRELGSGGMATVYLAEDRKHKRSVAIKVLRPDLAHTIGVERFLREIEVIARLQHPHILTLIDSGEVGGVPYYVMPYVEGESLQALAEREASLPVEEAVRIVGEVADGLHYAHQQGVIHRDIKPANILMSGGHPVISDFGIANALEHATMGRITETGISLGSPLYMSPEQAAGDRNLDARSDIYSLGCVLYELVAGRAPIAEGSIQAVVTRKMLGEFEPLAAIRKGIPPRLDAVVAKALATQAADRFASAQAFADALADAVRPADGAASPRDLRKRRMAAAAGTLVLVAVAVGVTLVWARGRAERHAWAAQQLTEIERLASSAQFAAAFALATDFEDVVGNDTILERLRPTFTSFLAVRTDPPNARLYRQRYDVPLDQWEFVGVTPIESLPLPRFGSKVPIRLKIEADGYRTVELLPEVLADWTTWRGLLPLDTLRLDREAEIPIGMVRVPGFATAHPVRDGDSLRFRDYFMDRFEVTNREYKAFVDAGGYRTEKYWSEPVVKDGRGLSWAEAMAEFVDQTGMPGPSTWRYGTFPSGEEDFPVGGVSWYEAMAYARFVGKQLPNSWHWYYAALRFSRETNWVLFPNSNLGGAGPRAVGLARGMNEYGLYDVAGNVREWNANSMGGERVTRGAAWNDPDFQVGWLIPKSPFDRDPTHGFRLMRHFEDDTTYSHVTIPRSRTATRDYRGARPVSDAEYRIYRRLYDYERTPLNATVDSVGSLEHYTWERVTFDPPYEGREAGAYIFLPIAADPPFQAVVYWPGSNAMNDRVLDQGQPIWAWTGFIPQSGRALVLPLYDGTFERDDAEFSLTWGRTGGQRNTAYYRDVAVKWIKDLQRTIDYLETREDIDTEAIGFYGFSWGGAIAPLALAVEERFKAAVLDVGGLWTTGEVPLPEVEPLNFLPRVRTPVLMVNGQYDQVFPYETSQVPFFQLLGTPPEHKRHYVSPAAHLVPREEMIREALAWYDKYLGTP